MFEQKKVVYPPVPFYIGSYKFSKVKSTTKFVKEIEYFLFGEMIFHRNDFENRVPDHCTTSRVHFEYAYFWDKDEEVFRNAQNMTTLRRRFKQKITTIGGKGKDAEKLKRKEEAYRLAQEAED